MKVRHWFRPPRHVLAIFVVVAIVSAAALAWLMWLLLEQDKAVEMQRRQERLEQAADRAAAVMQAAMTDLDRASESPSGVLFVQLGANELRVRPPGSLIYYPEPIARPQAPPERFVEGEQAEFARADLQTAAALYARLSSDADKNVRAGALTRLARVHRKLGDHDAALRSSDTMAQITDANVSGLPAGLVASEGRASVFEETRRAADLHREAALLVEKLRSGYWQFTKPEYEFYPAEAAGRIGNPESAPDAGAIAQAEAVSWLWENRNQPEPGLRRLVQTAGSPALIVSRPSQDGLIAAVAGPSYFASLCREAVPDPALRCTLSDGDGRIVVGEAPPVRAAAIRTATVAKLPWNVQVFASPESDVINTSPRRRLLLWVAAVLSFVWLTGAAFIVRAIGREARVAQLQSSTNNVRFSKNSFAERIPKRAGSKAPESGWRWCGTLWKLTAVRFSSSASRGKAAASRSYSRRRPHHDPSWLLKMSRESHSRWKPICRPRAIR